LSENILSEDNMSETEIDEIGHQLAALLANPAELHVLVFVVDVLGSILLIHFGRNLREKNKKVHLKILKYFIFN
jgi:hypothetical protein